jgi:micrococcal nuclease
LILKSGQKKKLYKSETGLIFWNTSDSANIIYDNKIIDSLSWNFVISENFLLTKDMLSSVLQKVLVLKIIDWDTIEVEFENGTREKLRFIWVDTPETKHPKKPVEEFWLEASNFTKSYLSWKYIYLDIPWLNRDKYDRLLAYIYLNNNQDEASFNEILIQKWLARAYLRFPFSKYDSFEKTEKDAKKAKIGMWWNKEVLEYVKELEKQEEVELEEEKKKEIYDFSFLFW